MLDRKEGILPEMNPCTAAFETTFLSRTPYWPVKSLCRLIEIFGHSYGSIFSKADDSNARNETFSSRTFWQLFYFLWLVRVYSTDMVGAQKLSKIILRNVSYTSGSNLLISLVVLENEGFTTSVDKYMKVFVTLSVNTSGRWTLFDVAEETSLLAGYDYMERQPSL